MNEIAYGIGEITDEKVTFSFSTKGMHKPITNGDVIKAVFPKDVIIEANNGCTYFGAKVRIHTDWWNAPYKAESEEKE